MDAREIKALSLMDQANAYRRDAIAESWQFSNAIFQLPDNERRQILESFQSLAREMMAVIAEDAGNQPLVDLLAEVSE